MNAVFDRVKQDMLCFSVKAIERLNCWIAETSPDERIQVEARRLARQINLVFNEMLQLMDQIKTHDEMVTRWFEVIL